GASSAGPGDQGGASLASLAATGSPAAPPTPARLSRIVLLTSGTTGKPKGASRSGESATLAAAAAVLSKIPLRANEVTVVAAPLFHAWGFANLSLAMALSSTLVLRRRFDPEAALSDVARHRATALAATPVMLHRIMNLGEAVRARYDTSCLRVVAVSGEALPGELATRWMDAFGDNLYNLYGSTEVAWATIATPLDLREAPGTAGRPPLGTELRLLDGRGADVTAGDTGRVFVRNCFLIDGYTNGTGSPAATSAGMATGDVGHLDDEGRLFIDGRDDDMIVSGGENVYPKEVEDLLARHPAVAEVAVVGVADQNFGERLKAAVVLAAGAEVSEEALKSYVRDHLARYKTPREVRFLDELPRNPTGKVIRAAIREL
ncbi:MAG: AMP-binding protein, partial [Acidimicrobiales bacterium]